MIRRHVVFVIVSIGLMSAMAGCSRSPRVTYYTLEPSAPVETTATATAVPSIVVGPVTLPELVDRPQLVVRLADNRVDILETHRWAEPLKNEIPRMIAENLSRMLGTVNVSSYAQYSGANADYRLLVDFQRFESNRGENVSIGATWTLRRAAGGAQKSGRVMAREPVGAQGYDPLVAAYSRALRAVSADLAQAIRSEIAERH